MRVRLGSSVAGLMLSPVLLIFWESGGALHELKGLRMMRRLPEHPDVSELLDVSGAVAFYF